MALWVLDFGCDLFLLFAMQSEEYYEVYKELPGNVYICKLKSASGSGNKMKAKDSEF